jgi:branched-chain amino acid transport system substrate-binding protein
MSPISTGRRRRFAALTLGTALAVTLAACGSSSGGGTPSQGSSSAAQGSGGGNANSAEGFTATSITIEGSVDKTSASGQSEALADLGAKARFARANKEGGVNGRTINYLGAIDNKLDPSLDLPTAKKIVQQDKAFAVVPVVSPVLSTGGQYWIQQKVPFYGWGIGPAFCNNPYGFGYSGCLVPTAKDDEVSTASAGLMDKVLGIPNGNGKTVAMISEDSASGQFGIKVIQAAFVADGWKVTYSKAALPATTAVTDYTPYAQAILTSNGGKAPDVMFHVTTVPNTTGLGAALTQAGFKGPQENAVTYDPAFLESPTSRQALQNAYAYIQYGSFEDKNSSANKQMLADVEAVEPKQTVLTADIAIGYYSADLFLHHLQLAGKNLSRAGFIKAANDGSSYSVPNGLGTLSFPDNHQKSVACGSLVQVQGAKYVEKVPLTCFKTTPLSVLGS